MIVVERKVKKLVFVGTGCLERRFLLVPNSPEDAILSWSGLGQNLLERLLVN